MSRASSTSLLVPGSEDRDSIITLDSGGSPPPSNNVLTVEIDDSREYEIEAYKSTTGRPIVIVNEIPIVHVVRNLQ